MKIGNLELDDFPLVLSPMDDITDKPFRGVCKRFGADLLITEFIASEALVREVEKSRRKMQFDEAERPIGIQIFGHDADALTRSLQFVEQARPDFVDINWGCPMRKIAARGAGSGALRDPERLVAITADIVKASKLPVTVKTRLGYDDSSTPIVELAERLQDVGVAAISIHGRTKTQLYRGTADWTLIGKVKENPRMTIPVFGNGDITTPEMADEYRRRYGVDGILIGRAAIGNPWIFEQTHRVMDGQPQRKVSVAERAEVCRKHLLAAVQWKGERTAVLEMRKHYSGYFKGLFDFKPFRMKLVSLTSVEELLPVFDEIAEHYQNC
ncbi:MAG: tRNA dihydrouridine synthase DusB [Bacteroidales bacterium]|nr:tRNA dihydrouridine synthase DusB [Bacteroidales bacterium]MBR5028477.1 tRNA dihydrouridine synthase DusB [Bacteroidales bacterium]